MLHEKLKNPPYLEVAFDIPDWRRVEGIIHALPNNDSIIIEAGTPLIKRYGIEICQKMHQIRPDSVVLADLKTIKYGRHEARIACDATADVMAFAGVAPIDTQEAIIKECHDIGILPLLDTISLKDPIPVLDQLEVKPDIIELHRAIDQELTGTEYQWQDIPKIKKIIGNGLVAVAGGIKVPKVKEAQNAGADILVVGRAITCAKNVNSTTNAFLREMGVL
jgi:bifunctional enzyme Fae/Hps|tara:strand:- start:121 stop:783 length:663 start_codon:yes stop_codon:yes gene_type:complete